MRKAAKDSELSWRTLPKEAPSSAPSTVPLTRGLKVGEVLQVSTLADARLLAGASGLERTVQRLNVMEVPDILAWVKPHELLLTTGYPLRNTPQSLVRLVADLDERGLAALAIKPGRYLDELPAEMLSQADRLGFPIIELPGHVSFDDILNQVLTDILNRQAAVLARAEEAHRALVQIVLGGGGLQEVCDELVGLLGGAAFVADTEGRLLAEAGSGEDVAAARAASCFEASGRMRGCSGQAGGAKDGAAQVGARSHSGLEGSHVLVPIVAGSLDHGRIAVFSRHRELGDMDVHILERAATVTALVITKRLAVQAVEGKYQGDFLHDLLHGRAGSVERTVPHSAALGWDIDRPLVVVAAELDSEPEEGGGEGLRHQLAQERFASAWTAAVRTRDPRAAAAGFPRAAVALLGVPPGGEVTRVVREIAGQVASGAVPRAFSTGVSRVTSSPDELPAAYDQARRAVLVGRRMRGAGSVVSFDELGVFRLLSLVPDAEELRSFTRETLGELATRDDSEAEDLRRVLRTLLDTNLNVAQTARALHFHYNTLRYRIAKLERMLGPFTTDPNLRLNLALALQIIQMRAP
jgi:PucR family transcriptional regulator, purine catabolism regulatory protein